MLKQKVDIVCITLSSPILIGIYRENRLIDSIVTEERSSEVLPIIFDELLEKYELSSLIYANGPGSFMAIKVSYIFLKSLSILKEIPLYCTDAFYFNNNKPIKAIGKLCFVKIHDKIITKKCDEEVGRFTLPKQLVKKDFTQNCLPSYGIGAV
ncbi:MAG: hypothetical protein GXO11_00475 [Epsilonproteobacteria bacterium]|nr:hypothetical protein [Campylobacterota bacterium]